MYNFTTNSSICNVIIYKLTDRFLCKNNGVTFLCMLSGDASLKLLYETHEESAFCLTERDVLLLWPEEEYELESEASSLILELSFDYIFFKQSFSYDTRRILCNSVLDPNRDYSTLRMYLARIAMVYYSDPSENRFFLLSNIYHLFHYMNSEFPPVTTDLEGLSKQQQKLNKITSFIRKNYQKPIVLQDISKLMDFTPQYLEKFLKQHLNQTFYEYLNQIRLLAALELLQYTDYSVPFIASSCGFPNGTAFSKAFLGKYGKDPSNYKNELSVPQKINEAKQAASITEPRLARDFITNHIRTTSITNSIVTSSSSERIVVNAMKSKLYSPVWKALTNLGFCFNFEKPSFRMHLMELQSELHFNYGRIQGILDLIDIYSSDETTTYTFIKVFRIIDFLRSIQMYPFFELGNKPYSIYKDMISDLPSEDVGRNYPKRIKELLPIFMKNCINRYGFQEVALWKFELWMEYNTDMSVLESPAMYVSRLQFVYDTVKSFVPAAMIGGPGFNTFMDIIHLEEIYKEMLKKHLNPDFISFYLYPYIRPAGSSVTPTGELITLLSKNKDQYKKYIEQITTLTYKYFLHKPELYATEYSSYISSHNYINDSTYLAAFIVKETIDNLGGAAALGYWIVSDLSIEYGDNADILFGGNGLMSKDGIKKPSYHAFRFLEKLGDHLIAKGNHYIVTSDSNRRYQVLVYHYSYFNEDYCENQKKFELLRYPSSAFEPLPPMDFTMTLTNLIPGTYSIRQHTLDQGHGSVLYEWLRMDTPKDLGPQEINYLKNISVPGIRITKKEVTASLELSCHLNINELTLFEIDLYLS